MYELIDQPTHRFDGIEEVEAQCPECAEEFYGEPDGYDLYSVGVNCPNCSCSFYVTIEEED